MRNFELRFACRMADGSIVPLIRTIGATDLSWATRIGQAMCGELVAPGQWLDQFVGAVLAPEPGNRAAELTLGTRIVPSGQVWVRVLHMLGLRPDQVKWVYNWQFETVGFFRWEAPDGR